MFGVVIWCDTHERKAVIWCEDHGDLAFCSDSGDETATPLDAGDWVQFDLTTDRHMRFAHNPKLIDAGVCPGLPIALEDAAQDAPGKEPLQRRSAEIITFSQQPSETGGSTRRALKLA
jgi:hypothetical protein